MKLEKLRNDLEKFRTLEREKTVRILGPGVLGLAGLGIVAWTVVRVTDKPAWVEIVLAMIALLSGQTVLYIRATLRLRTLLHRRRSPRPVSGIEREEGAS